MVEPTLKGSGLVQASREPRPVPGFEKFYTISDSGEVFSLRRSRTLKTYKHPKTGHLLVDLTSDKRYKKKVHRLVAEAFIGPCPGGQEVCHRDGDPENNSPDNLYYGSRSENVLDQVTHGVHNNSRKTHCPKGHEYTPENTRLYKGRRNCRSCHRVKSLEWYNRNKA